jgi:predicted dehydrogenase
MQLFAPGSLPEKNWAVSRPAPGEFRAMLAAGDICFSILISMNSRPTATMLRLFGSKGTIHVDLFHGFCVIESGKVSRSQKIAHPFDLATRILLAASANLIRRTFEAEPAYPGLRELVGRFYRAVATNTAPPIRREEAIEIAAVRERLASPASVLAL